jgi:hypothetical protein
MAKLKLLSAALLAAVVFAAPAMAREHHVTRHGSNNAYVDPADAAPDAAYAGYSYGAYGYRCVPAPRVGQFAGGPWTNDVACEPGSWNGAAY